MTPMRAVLGFACLGVVVGAVFLTVRGDWAIALLASALAVMVVLVVWRQGRVLSALAAQRTQLSEIQQSASWHQKELLNHAQSTFRRVLKWDSVDPEEVQRFITGFAAPAPAAPPAHESDPPAAPAGRLRGGRAATPDVANPAVSESVESILLPGRPAVVAGVVGDLEVPGTDLSRWRPGAVLSSLEARSPSAVVIDEQQLGSGEWFGAQHAAGAKLMAELLTGLAWARERSVPCYVLRAETVSGVNSHVLADSGAVVLPMADTIADEAQGAQRSPLLRRLERIAADRGVRN